MTGLYSMIKRNTKLFFKDKGMFFTSLITPVILLVLYATFLFKVYKDAFVSSLPNGLEFDERLINGAVGGQLLSSLLAVCCITVAFCSNMLMVNDKVSGANKDIAMTPIKRSTLSFSYYVSTVISTLLICLLALIAGMIYLGYVGWYLSAWDIIALIFDVFLLVLFGTALSSIVNVFLSTQGQISTVGTIVSSGYGFICGAYMPISQFNEGLQNIISFLPGTYGTVLLRKHAIRGAFDAMLEQNIPVEVVESFKDAVDCNLYVLDKSVSIGVMYTVLVGSTVALMGIYVFINSVLFKKREFNK